MGIKGTMGLFLSPVAAYLVSQMLNKELYDAGLFWDMIIYIMLLMILAWVIKKNIESSIEDKMNSAFFEDYKEIIDDLIQEKRIAENKVDDADVQNIIIN